MFCLQSLWESGSCLAREQGIAERRIKGMERLGPGDFECCRRMLGKARCMLPRGLLTRENRDWAGLAKKETDGQSISLRVSKSEHELEAQGWA